MEWQPIDTVYKNKDVMENNKPILLLTTGGIVEAWFSKGEWSEHWELGREYNPPVWVCCDDRFQIEIEENFHGEFGHEYYSHGVTHWMPLPNPPKESQQQ